MRFMDGAAAASVTRAPEQARPAPGRRDRLAAIMARTGLLRLLERAPHRPQLLVINYHRIGRRAATDFDPDVFSVDEDMLADQLSVLKRVYAIIGPDEAIAIIEGRQRLRSTAVLLTFDDGYLDNLTAAVPVLRAFGAPAVFFLVTGYLSQPRQVPWWDEIASLVRASIGRQLSISAPQVRSFLVTRETVDAVIREVLRIYRSPGVRDPEAFLAELRHRGGAGSPSQTIPLLMGWPDARELQDAGMSVGLHTHSHRILGKLGMDEQRRELDTCRRLAADNLGREIDLLAYPVGARDAFSADTKRLAREAGFRAAFSFCGGTNRPGAIDAYDVRRVAFPDDLARRAAAQPSR